MNVESDFALRLDRVESRDAIGELCAAYCIACDDQDMESLRAVFTDDVVIETRNGLMNASGIDAVMAMYKQTFAVRGPSFHWTHDRFVQFDESDVDIASGRVLAHAETTPNDRVSVAALRYEDLYHRKSGRWLIARRRLFFLYYVPVSDYAQRLGRSDRVWARDQWIHADFPEVLGPWSGWEAP